MGQLDQIVHDDRSVTIYWRCPICSHVQVTRTEAVSRSQSKDETRRVEAITVVGALR